MKRNLIKISSSALNRFKHILSETKSDAIHLSLKSGGCNGFEYKMKPTNNKIQKPDELIKIDNVEIQICNKSLMYIIGTEIGWEKNLMSSGFTFKNPLITSSCGCGTSFDFKI